jgi:hypothetical protein
MLKERAEKAKYVGDLVANMPDLAVIVTADFDWWNPATWSSRYIRMKTASKWSHVQVAGAKGSGVGYSTGLRFKRIDLVRDLMAKDSFAIYSFPGLTGAQIGAGLRACESEIGKLYPVIDLLSMIVQNTVDPGAYRLKVDSKDKICSQFVAWLYRDVLQYNLAPQLDKDISMMTPADCVNDQRRVLYGCWPRNIVQS